MGILEDLVAALNIFMKAVAPNSRVQICTLGENILSGLLYLWDNYPSDALKVQCVWDWWVGGGWVCVCVWMGGFFGVCVCVFVCLVISKKS